MQKPKTVIFIFINNDKFSLYTPLIFLTKLVKCSKYMLEIDWLHQKFTYITLQDRTLFL